MEVEFCDDLDSDTGWGLTTLFQQQEYVEKEVNPRGWAPEDSL